MKQSDYREAEPRRAEHGEQCGWQECSNPAYFIRDTPWGDLPVCTNHVRADLFDEKDEQP